MALLKIEPFIIDSTANFTFANANITSNLISGNANLGNLATANFFSGNGSLITYITGANVNGQVGNALIAGTVYTNAQPNITSVGTLTSLIVGNTTANATFGNGTITLSGTGNVTGGNLVSANYITGTLTTAAQPNITSVGTLTGLTVNGDITSTGNLIVAGQTTYVNSTNTAIEDPLIYQGGGANNATLTSDDGHDRGTILNYYTGGAATQAFMGWKNASKEFEFASNVSVTTGVATVATYGNIKAGSANLGNSVTSNYFIGNGSTITYITGANVNGQVGNALIAGTVYTNAQPNITSVGNLTSLVVGNVTAGNVTGANLVSANYVSGNGSLLSSITGANVTGVVANATYATSAGSATTAATVTTAAQPNITSVGTLAGITATGIINLTGASNVSLGSVANLKITGGSSGYVLSTDGAGNLTWGTVGEGTGNANVSGANTQVFFNNGNSNTLGTSANFAFNKTSNTLSVDNITLVSTGNITGGNLLSAGYLTGTLTTASQPNITSVGTLTSLAVSGTSNLNSVSNVTITGGSNGQFLKTNGSGVLSWANTYVPTLSATADQFTGNGVQTAYTLSSTPANINLTFAAVQGVLQPKSTYTISGATLTFSQAPPNQSIVEITTLTVS
jgi:hypothetical protein